MLPHRHLIAWMVNEDKLGLLTVQGDADTLLPVLLVCTEEKVNGMEVMRLEEAQMIIRLLTGSVNYLGTYMSPDYYMSTYVCSVIT